MLISVCVVSIDFIYGETGTTESSLEYKGPILKDTSLSVEKFVTGLDWPTKMSFVDNDILVNEKNTGKVRLIRKGVLQDKPVLDVAVNAISERGLLGITTKNSSVYLYFTESLHDGGEIIGTHIYKYYWNGSQLTNATLIKKLPFDNKITVHYGGAMLTHSDGTVYAAIGDLKREGMLQNFPKGVPDDTGVILAIEPEGPYYAVGIRNIFGLAEDPLTGNIWNTENGPNNYDEINFVKKNFNSGSKSIMGPATKPLQNVSIPNNGVYVYSDPEFTWEEIVAPTEISFVESDLFTSYKNSVLVGDFINGFLYEFKLNKDRTGFVFDNPSLSDLVGNNDNYMQEIIFGTGFGGITDIDVGPDGLIYVVSITHGTIYRISPSETNEFNEEQVDCDRKPAPRINLSGCNLVRLNLPNMDLSFVNFSNTNLYKANLQGTIFYSSDLTDANFSEADLSNAKMRYAKFSGVNLENAKLMNVDLRNSYLKDVNLANADLTKVSLFRAKLTNVNLEESNLNGADLTQSDFSFVNLQGSNLSNAILNGINLKGANLAKADLRGAVIMSIDFSGVDISETNIELCPGEDFFHKELNKILKAVIQIELISKALQFIILKIC